MCPWQEVEEVHTNPSQTQKIVQLVAAIHNEIENQVPHYDLLLLSFYVLPHSLIYFTSSFSRY